MLNIFYLILIFHFIEKFLLDRIAIQKIEIFMIPINEQCRVWFLGIIIKPELFMRLSKAKKTVKSRRQLSD